MRAPGEQMSRLPGFFTQVLGLLMVKVMNGTHPASFRSCLDQRHEHRQDDSDMEHVAAECGMPCKS